MTVFLGTKCVPIYDVSIELPGDQPLTGKPEVAKDRDGQNDLKTIVVGFRRIEFSIYFDFHYTNRLRTANFFLTQNIPLEAARRLQTSS